MNSRIWISIILALSLCLTAGCDQSKAKDGEAPIIRTNSEFDRNMIEVETLSKHNLEKIDNGIPLEDYEEDQLRRAKLIFEGLIGFQPELAGLYLGLGKIQQYFGDHEGAIKTFSTGADYITDLKDKGANRLLAEFYYLASISYEGLRNYEAVDQFIQKALEIDAKNPNFLSVRASSALQQGNVTAAKNDLAAALKIDPEHRRSKQLLKLIAAEEGDTKQKSGAVPGGNGG